MRDQVQSIYGGDENARICLTDFFFNSLSAYGEFHFPFSVYYMSYVQDSRGGFRRFSLSKIVARHHYGVLVGRRESVCLIIIPR